jgi:hypothetical protein
MCDPDRAYRVKQRGMLAMQSAEKRGANAARKSEKANAARRARMLGKRKGTNAEMLEIAFEEMLQMPQE